MAAVLEDDEPAVGDGRAPSLRGMSRSCSPRTSRAGGVMRGTSRRMRAAFQRRRVRRTAPCDRAERSVRWCASTRSPAKRRASGVLLPRPARELRRQRRAGDQVTFLHRVNSNNQAAVILPSATRASTASPSVRFPPRQLCPIERNWYLMSGSAASVSPTSCAIAVLLGKAFNRTFSMRASTSGGTLETDSSSWSGRLRMACC